MSDIFVIKGFGKFWKRGWFSVFFYLGIEDFKRNRYKFFLECIFILILVVLFEFFIELFLVVNFLLMVL